MQIKCKFLISVTQLRELIYSWLNSFCFSKSNLITAEFKLKPCTFWTAHAHDNISRNWVLLMAGYVVLYLLMYIDLSLLLIGTHLLFLATKPFSFILICPAETSSKATYFILINTNILHSTYLTINKPVR